MIVVGDGDQAAAVERLRSELEERGWFDDDQKQQPPAFPERVGIVTSLPRDAQYDIQSMTIPKPSVPTSVTNGIC
ncbi:hypothetical protein [Natronobacterium haloterrestre]|uniref:hypothetical protein n=1 Tax=Natronobacterium haloterrestre TaxID=148448 RepID=UPI001FE030BF|nr:hypothetical protein [Halobiforma haloterrestris]